MLTARHAAIRLLKLMMVASLVLPAVLFAFAATVSYRNFERVSDERIDRSLDILHEHALKVLQTIERTFAEIDEVVRGMSDDDIRLNEGVVARPAQADRRRLAATARHRDHGSRRPCAGFVQIYCRCRRISISPTRDYFKAQVDRQTPAPM